MGGRWAPGVKLGLVLLVVTLLVSELPVEAAKRGRRLPVTLLVNKVAPSTEARYVNKVEGLERFIQYLGGPSLQLLGRDGCQPSLADLDIGVSSAGL